MAAAGRRRRTRSAHARAPLIAWTLLSVWAPLSAWAPLPSGAAAVGTAASAHAEEVGPPGSSPPNIRLPDKAQQDDLRGNDRRADDLRASALRVDKLQTDELRARLEAAEKQANHSLTALIVVAALLLLFGAIKAAQVRGYLRQIEAANRELDERVRQRTRELSEANESLRLEIAERERVESRLRIAHKLKSLGQLAAGVAHEINTPTQYVSDNVAFAAAAWREVLPLLEDREQQQKQQPTGANLAYLRTEVPAALAQALHGLQQIAGIVAAMRNLSHPGGTVFEPADLNKAIESTALVARNEWKHDAELTLRLDADLPLVHCDVSAVSQAVLNLIVNAAQAIAEARASNGLGCITITTRRSAAHAEISIEDDGPGVAQEIEDRIFDPFFTTKDVGVGTGQGLAIAHSIIADRHGGSLTYEPGRGGHGARFVIRLPLEPCSPGRVDATEEWRAEEPWTEEP